MGDRFKFGRNLEWLPIVSTTKIYAQILQPYGCNKRVSQGLAKLPDSLGVSSLSTRLKIFWPGCFRWPASLFDGGRRFWQAIDKRK